MALEFKILVQAIILALAVTFSVASILKMVTVITKMGMSKILSFNFLGIPILLTIFLSMSTSIFYQEIGSFIAEKVELIFLSSSSVDICKCLTEAGNSEYMLKNGDACRDAISKELGVDNWEKVNFSKNANLSAKFDALANKCK
jgi:hypothetical protein